MHAMLRSHLTELELGELQQFQNLAIFPLLATAEHDPAYLTLSEAMEQGLLAITEVVEGGSVPELKSRTWLCSPSCFWMGRSSWARNRTAR